MRIEDKDFEYEERRRSKRRPSFDIEAAKDFVIDHYQYFGVAILFICLVIILCVFSNAVKDKKPEADKASEQSTESGIEVPQTELEVDKYADVNSLVDKYFKATASGDTDALKTICPDLDEKEALDDLGIFTYTLFIKWV